MLQPSTSRSASPPQSEIQEYIQGRSQNEPSDETRAQNGPSTGTGAQNDPSNGTRAQKFLRLTERILLIALQVFGLTAAIIFGVWAPMSYALAQKAYDDQRIATNLSFTALVHQQYANRLAELSNRWSEYSYNLTVVQLRLSIMQLCKEYPVSSHLSPIEMPPISPSTQIAN